MPDTHQQNPRVKINFCIENNGSVYLIYWISESKDGIYSGIQFKSSDWHASFHRDGNSHIKNSSHSENRKHRKISAPLDAYIDVSINEIAGFRCLDRIRLPISNGRFSDILKQKTLEKSAKDIILPEGYLKGKRTLVIDLWISDLKSFEALQRRINSTYEQGENPELIMTTAILENFPNHKIVVVLKGDDRVSTSIP